MRVVNDAIALPLAGPGRANYTSRPLEGVRTMFVIFVNRETLEAHKIVIISTRLIFHYAITKLY